jgi:hypothetical protein
VHATIALCGLPTPDAPRQLEALLARQGYGATQARVQCCDALCSAAYAARGATGHLAEAALLQVLAGSSLVLLTEVLQAGDAMSAWLRERLSHAAISYAVLPHEPKAWACAAQAAATHALDQLAAPKRPAQRRWQWHCEGCDQPECERRLFGF